MDNITMENKTEYGVTVIIPAYNAEKTIKNTIESVYRQTFQDVQIIVVNDGSTDGTLGILSGYSDRDNLNLINQENQGVSAARNAGIRNALGKYVFFLDSDDFIGYNVLESLYRFAEEKQLELVACEFKQVSYGHKEDMTAASSFDFYTEDKNGVASHFFDVIPNYSTAKLFLLESLLRNDVLFPLDMSFGEDLCFVYSLMTHITRIGKVRGAFYYLVNFNPLSLSRKHVTNMQSHIEAEYRAWKSACKAFLGLEENYNKNHMSYGFYLASIYMANFFKPGCDMGFLEKYQHIRLFVKSHRQDYLADKGCPSGMFEKITAATLGTGNAFLMAMLFFVKEKIRIITNRRGKM